ncbi:hypothetical protein [Variovorax sp. PAMC 28711]|uniref:hypothetical protein n=1 Tax=Variovorax sp. PAMC 28711 TaxID=1795631 RepID=UPI0012E79DCE|nr:hypothetical protein [Variovorax sp. PAMC 28711]
MNFSRATALCLLVLVAGTVSAQQVTLRCDLTYLKDGTKSELWVVIDPAANMMRVNGSARSLVMTNERYIGSDQSGAFTRIASIDRNTGEIDVSSVYENQVVLPSKGICAKATPPATKF